MKMTGKHVLIAKFYNHSGSKPSNTRVFVIRSFPLALACECQKAQACAHTYLVRAFLASGVQQIGRRFKIYPETLAYLGPKANRKNAALILAEIEARSKGMEPTVKANVLPAGVNAGPATVPAKAPAPAVTTPAVVLQAPEAKATGEKLCGWLDITAEELAERAAKHTAAKAKKMAEKAAEAAALQTPAKTEAAKVKDSDRAAELAKAGKLAIDLD